MTLGTSRIVLQGETPYAHEREAIDFTIQSLPNNDPYNMWALLELLDPSSGRLYEIDLIVLGYAALYLIEVKSGPGRYEGDTQDWYRRGPEEGAPRYMDPPYRLTNHKAKVLASRLRSKMKGPLPWIEPLVFLSAPGIELGFRNHGDHGVVTRETLLKAVQFHQFPGVDAGRSRPPITVPVMRDVSQALGALGVRARKGKSMVGAYELGAVVGEGPGYQDRTATHRDQKTFLRRARIYGVPQQTSVERRQQLRRAADREAKLLWDVRDHPNILRISDYVLDGELGPTVLFDAFDGIPLDAFLRKEHGTLGFFDRVTIIEQIGRALAFCHRKGVVHGALSPEAVLVGRHPTTNAIETRLFNFQLGLSGDVEATSHWSALASEPWAIYQAPELRENPAQRSPTSDVFSLGALAFTVLAGRAPATSSVEIDRLLHQHQCLDPRGVDDGLSQGVADHIVHATQLSPLNRDDDVESWVELLLSVVTRPEPAVALLEQDPLEARPGDIIGDDLIVEEPGEGRVILGQGASARVLLVKRVSDDRLYALKISLGPEHDERLGQEANVLAGIRHARVVQLIARHTFAGRPALLLSLAGTETLHRYLARMGTVSLELGSRFGEDLLSTLEHLEEHQLLHRDIKPANLGVGSVSNKKNHLQLFDFSLAAAPASDIQSGTAAYRDPHLRLRGAWDYAADRWSAAITLHEMLTGVRPTFGDHAALDQNAAIVIAVDRFDPAVRDSLAAFFTRALATDLDQRFPSGDALRRAWNAAFEAPAKSALPRTKTPAPTTTTTTTATTTTAGSESALVLATKLAFDDDDGALLDRMPPPVATAAQLTGVTTDTAIDALPLPPRAKNALDRAGMLVAGDLLGLADNRLSAIRGVGRQVADEILRVKNALLAAELTRSATDLQRSQRSAFFAGYRGADLALEGAALGVKAILVLGDAGLSTLSAVAQAPATQIRSMAQRQGFDAAAVHALLARENARANESDRPTTLEGLIDALLPQKKKGMKHPRELFGVDAPFRGRLDVTVRELAKTASLTTAAVYLALGKARLEWSAHAAFPDLRQQVHALVDGAGGAIPLVQAARGLLALLPFDRTIHVDGAEPAEPVAMAAALVRIVAEVEKDDDGGLRAVRLHERELWLCASDGCVRGVRALGHAADELAVRASVPGPGEVSRVLSASSSETPLSSLSLERLADIAAAASAGAARSARLEIYPRAMSPDRALELSASQLTSGLVPAEIRRRVHLRYPEAQPLPDRPALDELLRPWKLEFDVVTNSYQRPGVSEGTTNATRMPSSPRAKTALPTQARSMEPDAIGARAFDAQLKNAVERRSFRVLGVNAARAKDAARELGRRLGVAPTPFDKLLVQAMKAQMQQTGIKSPDVIHAADREGRAGPAWPRLLQLIERAAHDVAQQLLPATEPLLLVQPGPIARYRLEAFLQALMAASSSSSSSASSEAPCAAVFLLVPSTDRVGIPQINGTMAVPGLLSSQVLWVSSDWIDNKHNQPAGLPAGTPA